MSLTVSAFYKFIAIEKPEALRHQIFQICSALDIHGTILLAGEGINGTISGEDVSLAAFFEWLRADSRFSDLKPKKSIATTHPFGRLKVKVKREIVALGAPQADPARAVGVYVRPENWNSLIYDPGVLTVDVRNVYEVKIGSFRKAINPETRSFRQFPRFVREKLDPWKHRKIAMFCTGGIRCEKASSYLLAEGFQEVYHLEGGILKYLQSIPDDESLWEGECFVFDERVAVAHGMAPGSHRLCRLCGGPSVTKTMREGDGTERLCNECASTAVLPKRQ